MKKILVAFAQLVGHFAIAQSPGFRYGMHAGIGKSSFTGVELTGETGKISLSLGGTACKQFPQNIGIMGAVLITMKGSRYRGETEDVPGVFGPNIYKYAEATQLVYAELPLLIRYSLGWKKLFIKFIAGPSFNFNLYGSQTRTYDNPNYNKNNGFNNLSMSDIQVFELSGIYGAGIDIETKKGIYYVDFRVNEGITSWLNDASNHYYQIGIGYMFPEY